jgi:hypothetical protein
VFRVLLKTGVLTGSEYVTHSSMAEPYALRVIIAYRRGGRGGMDNGLS